MAAMAPACLGQGPKVISLWVARSHQAYREAVWVPRRWQGGVTEQEHQKKRQRMSSHNDRTLRMEIQVTEDEETAECLGLWSHTMC